MRKTGGLLLIGLIGLTACSAPSPSAEPSATESSATSNIRPLLSVPSESAIPTPTASLPPEFYDDSARGRYLAGVKKALNAWRDGVVPSDDDLLKGAEVACGLFASGKSREDIADMAGSSDIAKDNAAAIASFSSRELCTEYNTFR